MSASVKLSRLMELADSGPALRAALAEEVAELLACWPPDYPETRREICETLLAKAARDTDAASRAMLRARLQSQPGPAGRVLPVDVPCLVEAARSGRLLAEALAQSLSVDRGIARDILEEESGELLAVACKAACIDRTVFSALVLLTHPANGRDQAFAMLDAFDNVPVSEASRRLRAWQSEQRLSA